MPSDVHAVVLRWLLPHERARARATCRAVYAAPICGRALRVWQRESPAFGTVGVGVDWWGSAATEVEIVVVGPDPDLGLVGALFPDRLPGVSVVRVVGAPIVAAAVARRIMARTTGLREVTFGGPWPALCDVPAVPLAVALRHRTGTVVLSAGELRDVPPAIGCAPDARKLVVTGVCTSRCLDRVCDLFPRLERLECAVLDDVCCAMPPVPRVLVAVTAAGPCRGCCASPSTKESAFVVSAAAQISWSSAEDLASAAFLPLPGTDAVAWVVQTLFDRRGPAVARQSGTVVVPGVRRVSVLCAHCTETALANFAKGFVFPDAEELGLDEWPCGPAFTGIGRAFPRVKRLLSACPAAMLDTEFPLVDEVVIVASTAGHDEVLAALSQRAPRTARRMCVVHPADAEHPPSAPPPPGVAFVAIDLSEPQQWRDWLATAPATVRAEVRRVHMPVADATPGAVEAVLDALPGVCELTLVARTASVLARFSSNQSDKAARARARSIDRRLGDRIRAVRVRV